MNKMDRNQIAAIYDSFPESQRDMPKEVFIKKALGCIDPIKNTKILDAMVQKKRWGNRNKAQIDRAMKGGPK